MKKTRREIAEALPDVHSEAVDVLADELDRIQALKVLFRSEGGVALVNVLRSNCAVALNKLVQSTQDRPDIDSLMAIVAKYKANLDLLAELQDITTEAEIQKQLDDAVKEALALVT